jgi:hypothetical protein
MLEVGLLRALSLIQIEGWEDILGIIVGAGGSLALCGVIAFFIYRGRVRTRELVHKERIALIEKAGEVPGNIEELLLSVTVSPENDLRTGLIWSIIGIGLTLTLFFMEETRPWWPSGLIAIFVGLAYLAGYLFVPRRRWSPEAQGKPSLIIQATSIQTLAENPQSVALPAQEISVEQQPEIQARET